MELPKATFCALKGKRWHQVIGFGGARGAFKEFLMSRSCDENGCNHGRTSSDSKFIQRKIRSEIEEILRDLLSWDPCMLY